jgi:Regulator of chromosome condensation (RCC1) repeat
MLGMPTGLQFSSLSCGFYHCCGLLTNFTVKCWGNSPPAPPANAEPLASIATQGSESILCGLRLSDSGVVCWRGANPYTPYDPKRTAGIPATMTLSTMSKEERVIFGLCFPGRGGLSCEVELPIPPPTASPTRAPTTAPPTTASPTAPPTTAAPTALPTTAAPTAPPTTAAPLRPEHRLAHPLPLRLAHPLLLRRLLPHLSLAHWW